MDIPSRNPPAPSPASPVPGDRIRIIRGELAGLTGCITRLTEEGKFVLRIDNLAEGVNVVLGASALEHLA